MPLITEGNNPKPIDPLRLLSIFVFFFHLTRRRFGLCLSWFHLLPTFDRDPTVARKHTCPFFHSYLHLTHLGKDYRDIKRKFITLGKLILDFRVGKTYKIAQTAFVRLRVFPTMLVLAHYSKNYVEEEWRQKSFVESNGICSSYKIIKMAAYCPQTGQG